MLRLISELQRRKVLRVGAAYLVGAWIILQVAGSLENALNLPSWFDTVVLAFLVVGFPVALSLAWFFEFTPEGIKRTLPAGDGAMSRPGASDWTMAGLLAVAMVVAVAVAIVQPLSRRASTQTPTAATPAASVESKPAETPGAPDRHAVAEASVAVLPFANLSSEKENDYFAAGIHAEILTRLSKISALKVISRTSTEQYASRPERLSDIARKLGVANILEGTVQKIGDTARINVQLIRAATDQGLWGESYDRKVADIFSVQTEIATAIALALNAKISPSEEKAISQELTSNPKAYDAYLRALKSYRELRDTSELKEIEKYLREAVELDPAFAAAWALLSRVHEVAYWYWDATEGRRSAARTALDRAYQLNPDFLEVRLADAYYKYYVEEDFGAARRQFEELDVQWPGNSDILFALASIAKRQGRWDANIAYLDRVFRIDPLRLDALMERVTVQSFTRDYAGALKTVDLALAIAPKDSAAIGAKVSILQALDRLDDADALLSTLPPREAKQSFGVALAFYEQSLLRRSYEEAITRFESLIATAETDATGAAELGTMRCFLGYLLLFAGKEKDAREQLTLGIDGLNAELEKQPNNVIVIGELASMYAGLGDRDNALKFLDRGLERWPEAKDAMGGAEQWRILVWAMLGDRSQAVPELARQLKAPGWWTWTAVRRSAYFDKLRGDPAFEALLAEGGHVSSESGN